MRVTTSVLWAIALLASQASSIAFGLPGPSVDVVFPSGGETLLKGSEYRIRWEWSNYMGSVGIHIYKGGTSSTHLLQSIAASEPVTSGDLGYPFTPPRCWPDGDDYYVRVATPDDLAFGLSSAFSIRMPNAFFSRADANGDGKLDIADSVFVLNHLFLGGMAPACADAADANDDGALDVSDAVFALLFLFSGGLGPPPPFPGCGGDPTADSLACSAYEECTSSDSGATFADDFSDPKTLGSHWISVCNQGSPGPDCCTIEVDGRLHIRSPCCNCAGWICLDHSFLNVPNWEEASFSFYLDNGPETGGWNQNVTVTLGPVSVRVAERPDVGDSRRVTLRYTTGAEDVSVAQWSGLLSNGKYRLTISGDSAAFENHPKGQGTEIALSGRFPRGLVDLIPAIGVEEEEAWFDDVEISVRAKPRDE